MPLYTIFFLSPSFVEYITNLKVKQAARVAVHMESKLIPDKSRELHPSILTDDILKKLRGTSKDFSLKRVRILFPDGRILYSNNDDEVGEIINLEKITPIITRGEKYTKFIKKGAPDQEGDRMDSDTVETYVPIMRGNDLIGVFEIYYDISEDIKELKGVLKIFYMTLFPIVLVLFSSVIVSCRRTRRSILRRLEAKDQHIKKSNELQEKNDDLTEIIEICQDRKLKLEKEQKARHKAQEQVRQELLKRENMRIELLRHTVQAQEEERSRIARELHDETAQTLTAASLNFASLKNQLEGDPKVADVVDNLQNLCRQMNQDLYRLVHDLRPAQLDDLGLVPALRYLADEGQNNTGITVDFQVKGKVQRLDPFVETVIFRIVQESLTNVMRHAETDKATVHLDFRQDQRVVLRIHDKGKGFTPGEQKEYRTGWGLAGMAERVESINGTLQIDSEPGKGTVIEVIIPIIQQTSYCPMPPITTEKKK